MKMIDCRLIELSDESDSFMNQRQVPVDISN